MHHHPWTYYSEMKMSQNQSNQDDLLLIFGPQDLSFGKETAKTLRTALLQSSNLQWIIQALLELPQQRKSLEDAIPGLQDSDGEKHLRALVDWIRLGDLPDDLYPLPNVLLTPLVVVLQLAQYSSLIKQLYPEISADEKLPYLGGRHTETVGLCTGLLSATAVASSKNLQEFENHGAVAIRLAMALGAAVDADECQRESAEGQWQCFAVTWSSLDTNAQFKKAMDACLDVSYTLFQVE